MDVDGAALWNVEHGLGQDLPEGDDHADVGRELAELLGPLGIAQARGLKDAHAGGSGALLDRRRRHPLSAPGRAVGLGHHPDQLVTGQHGLEGGESELRRAIEQHPHACYLSPTGPARAGRSLLTRGQTRVEARPWGARPSGSAS